MGYGDGYPRSLSNKGWVLIHGKKAPILGRICMDQMMVDVSGIPEAKELDEVTLMGKDGEEELSVDTLGALSEDFPTNLCVTLESVCQESTIRAGRLPGRKQPHKIKDRFFLCIP